MRYADDRELACRNCGRRYPSDRLDRLRWCDRCRSVVVKRATIVGRVAGIIAALGIGAWIAVAIGPSSRFMIVWMILIVAVYFFVYKLTQRVAFEIIRARGVPPLAD